MKMPHSAMSVTSAACYAGSSIIMVILNKLLIARFFFDYPTVILMFQMATLLFGIELGRMVNLFKIQPYTFDRGKDMLLPSIFYSLHMYFSLTALEGMSLPMYGTIKRLLPMALVILSSVVLKKPALPRRALLAVALISGGAALATTYEFTSDWWSFVYGAVSLGFACGYLLLIERLALTSQYSCMDLVYMNSFNGLVFFLIADMIQDEIRDAFMYFLTSGSILFWWCLFGVMAFGVIMNVALIACTFHNSALDTSLVNAAKMTAQTFITWAGNFFLLYDILPTWFNIIGCFIVAFGLVLYMRHKKTETYTPLASSISSSSRKTLL